ESNWSSIARRRRLRAGMDPRERWRKRRLASARQENHARWHGFFARGDQGGSEAVGTISHQRQRVTCAIAESKSSPLPLSPPSSIFRAAREQRTCGADSLCPSVACTRTT